MTILHGFLTGDHKECDEAFVDAESAVASGDWHKANAAWRSFEQHLLRHFSMEEEVLFPAIEQRTGMTQGPTEVMRCDHEQMRALLARLDDCLTASDARGFLGLAETMMVLVQQHNMKEEQVLYPMADELLEDPQAVLAAMRARHQAE